MLSNRLVGQVIFERKIIKYLSLMDMMFFKISSDILIPIGILKSAPRNLMEDILLEHLSMDILKNFQLNTGQFSILTNQEQ